MWCAVRGIDDDEDDLFYDTGRTTQALMQALAMVRVLQGSLQGVCAWAPRVAVTAVAAAARLLNLPSDAVRIHHMSLFTLLNGTSVISCLQGAPGRPQALPPPVLLLHACNR
jgi:hypothetical protein